MFLLQCRELLEAHFTGVDAPHIIAPLSVVLHETLQPGPRERVGVYVKF